MKKLNYFLIKYGIRNFGEYAGRVIGKTHEYTRYYIDLMLELESEYAILPLELSEMFIYYLTTHGELDFDSNFDEGESEPDCDDCHTASCFEEENIIKTLIKSDKLKAVATPVVKWLRNFDNSLSKIIISSDRVELVGEKVIMSIPFKEED